MNNFKVGQKVKRVRGHALYSIFKTNHDAVFTVKDVSEIEGITLAECDEGSWFDDENFELYQEPVQIAFNPKPGDLIVTEGRGTYTCVNRTDGSFSDYRTYDFFGVNNHEFMAWMANGNAYRTQENPAPCIYDKFRVKEIIPVSTNNPVAIPQQSQDLSFQVKALELENQMLRMLLRREGVEV